jgi:hypothetical protein
LKKTILSILIFLSCITSYCQEAQKGYYITNGNQKIEGYFKPTDFFDVATIKFKKNLDSDYVDLPAAGIKEYAISDTYKFEKHMVDVDVSAKSYRNINYTKEPQFEKMDIFLEVILVSDATLYAYNDSNITKYFYSVKSKNVPITQLVYKTYKVSEQATAENTQFRQQLYTNVKCKNDDIKLFLKLRYERNELINLFKKYNDCNGYVTNVTGAAKDARYKIDYTLFAGAGISTFGGRGLNLDTNDEKSTAFGGGAEISVTFPSRFWSIFARAEYEQFSTEAKSENSRQSSQLNKVVNTFGLDYKGVNLHIGPRYNFNLNSKNTLFIDLAVAIAVPLAGDITQNVSVTNNAGTFDNATFVYNPAATAFFNFGLGYMFNNKFGADIRIDTNRDFIAGNVSEFKIKSSRMALNLRYTLN